MVFTRSIKRYGQTPAAETPWQRAGQVWDERIGSIRAQARNWLDAYGFATDRAAIFLTDCARSNYPLGRIG